MEGKDHVAHSLYCDVFCIYIYIKRKIKKLLEGKKPIKTEDFAYYVLRTNKLHPCDIEACHVQ